MVRRLLTRGGAAGLLSLLVVAAPPAFPPAAGAVNTRVSITNFAWSSPVVHVDLGEKVTWDWLGPDLAHSVTGVSPNARGLDSDPTTDAPSHRPGDSFTLQFSLPGTYEFQCKLHSFVRGEVVVSALPGDPNSDPGPQAPLNIDVTPPTLGTVQPRSKTFHGRKGVRTVAHVSERGEIDAEYYRVNSRGRRVYNGFARWKAFIGVNHFQLGARGPHFKARPGRYRVVLRAIDEAANESKPVRKAFAIGG